MIETDEIIGKIKKAKKLADVLDVNHFKSEFNTLIKKIHPDVCQSIEATDATAKLFKLKDEFFDGVVYTDDAGEFKSFGHSVVFTGDSDLLRRSYGNYTILKSNRDSGYQHFQKYMPDNIEFDGKKITAYFDKRAVPLSNLILPQEHVNWILSRMLEYSAWLAQIGYVHCGINPESIFIIPENHGIQVCSFYHLTKLDKKVDTISGKYQSWYPANLFATKKASSTIDLELSKKTAIYLLGDQSGIGIKLRKTHNEAFMDFVISQHNDAHKTFADYRKLLADNFEKKFHTLDI